MRPTISRATTTTMVQRTPSFIVCSQGVPHEGAGHAVAAPTALAELEPLDRDDLDARLAHLVDRVGVALVGHHHPRSEGDDVVAVVPLLALLLVLVPTRLDDPELGHPEGVRDGPVEALLLGHGELAARAAGPQADRTHLVHHARV